MLLDQDLIRRLTESPTSGSADVVRRAVLVLAEASGRGHGEDAAVHACRAHPGMAPIFNAAIRALAETERPGSLALFAARLARAPAALARVASEAFPEPARRGWHIATLSSSQGVRIALEALRRRGKLHVFCTEGRPALEGRRLAEWLASSGATVTCYADAAIAHALTSADAVLLGADAIGPAHALSRVGSQMLAHAASAVGVPVYLVASRDTFATRDLWPRLQMRDAAPDEVWPDAPPSVVVRNPSVEEVALSAVTAVITDIGLIAAEMVSEVCDGQDDLSLQPAWHRLRQLLAARGPL